MKFYIMTDLESVAGVGRKYDWVLRESPHYEEAKALLTGEVNAAVEALFDSGASEVHVADGHGCGGITPALLDKRAVLYNKWEPPYYPFQLNDSFDGVLSIGQHAKAGTLRAHLPHTGSHHVIERRINGRAIGEFGGLLLLANQLGIPTIFGSGDVAFTKEAVDLVPHMVTVAVKEGLNETSGEEYCFETYDGLFGNCTSLSPEEAKAAIYIGVKRAMLLLSRLGKGHFAPRDLPKPPYVLETEYRSVGGRPPKTDIATHESDAIQLFIEKPQTFYSFSHRGTQKRVRKPVWCSLGDSITFRNTWQPAVAKELELTHVNCGIGSTTVALPTHKVKNPAFCEEKRLGIGAYAGTKTLYADDGAPYGVVLANKPDIVTIFGGPNDTLYTKAMGTAEELSKPLPKKDRTVFFGAYSFVVETLLLHRPGVQIFPMTLFPMTASHNMPAVNTQGEINSAILQIAAFYNLPVIDLAAAFAAWKEDFQDFLPDGVHPNEAGGEKIAAVVARALESAVGKPGESRVF